MAPRRGTCGAHRHDPGVPNQTTAKLASTRGHRRIPLLVPLLFPIRALEILLFRQQSLIVSSESLVLGLKPTELSVHLVKRQG